MGEWRSKNDLNTWGCRDAPVQREGWREGSLEKQGFGSLWGWKYWKYLPNWTDQSGNQLPTWAPASSEGRACNFCSLLGVDVPQAELSALASAPPSMPQQSEFKRISSLHLALNCAARLSRKDSTTFKLSCVSYKFCSLSGFSQLLQPWVMISFPVQNGDYLTSRVSVWPGFGVRAELSVLQASGESQSSSIQPADCKRTCGGVCSECWVITAHPEPGQLPNPPRPGAGTFIPACCSVCALVLMMVLRFPGQVAARWWRKAFVFFFLSGPSWTAQSGGSLLVMENMKLVFSPLSNHSELPQFSLLSSHFLANWGKESSLAACHTETPQPWFIITKTSCRCWPGQGSAAN